MTKKEKGRASKGSKHLTDYDIHLFKKGEHFNIYEKLGSHITTQKGEKGTRFCVWAPNAQGISVIGDFNGWDPKTHPLTPSEDNSGIWDRFIPGVQKGAHYKYHVESRLGGYKADKGDPFANYWERPPGNASIVWDLDYDWGDDTWMKQRKDINHHESPMSIYEVHLGSWRRNLEGDTPILSYREIAPILVDYVEDMGFTHVELMPVMEHPFYGSWGYQTTGYFAPTARYGTPQDLMHLIDILHQRDIGVILDWVPSHFPHDEHGLAYFDGTHLYEHADPKAGFHPEWKSHIFNYARNEVKAFLISSALFWLERYHADGLRVDGVASMLYRDYGRKKGEWIPNRYGGRENIGAIDFLRRLNEAVFQRHPNVEMMAEESTSWPMVTMPTYTGGLGFSMKWNMGWMHDTLDYISKDPIFRKYHQDQLAFSIAYAFSENFLLPLSHDEVVHEKGSLIGRMPGDDWQKFANLRLMLGYMFTHPGKKLLFMGDEFGQGREWNHDESLDWHLLEHPLHKGIHKWVKDLHHLYKNEPALYQLDFAEDGFKWVDAGDWERSIISYLRKDKDGKHLLVVCNFTPQTHFNYGIGVPEGGIWTEVLNSDNQDYNGSGQMNPGGLEAQQVPLHGYEHSLHLTIPPLGIIIFKRKDGSGALK